MEIFSLWGTIQYDEAGSMSWTQCLILLLLLFNVTGYNFVPLKRLFKSIENKWNKKTGQVKALKVFLVLILFCFTILSQYPACCFTLGARYMLCLTLRREKYFPLTLLKSILTVMTNYWIKQSWDLLSCKLSGISHGLEMV